MQKAIIAIAVGLIGLTSCDQKRVAQVSSDNGPSLEETEKWINDTYNKHDGGSPGYGFWRDVSIRNGKLKFEHISHTNITFRNCNVSINYRENPVAELFSVIDRNAIESFYGGDLDLDSVLVQYYSSRNAGDGCDPERDVINCDYADIYFETKNKLPNISDKSEIIFEKLKGPDHSSKTNSKTYYARIQITDRQYLPHFEKAFKHWLKICGAKSSAF